MPPVHNASLAKHAFIGKQVAPLAGFRGLLAALVAFLVYRTGSGLLHFVSFVRAMEVR